MSWPALKRYWWLGLIIVYLLTRSVFLTRLAIFNDEAVYLDWGYRAWLFPDMVWYALLDGKTPLLMWLFGLAQRAPFDPLLMGRLVSVGFGALTLVGLMKLTSQLTKRKLALALIGLLYIATPWFAFYDRQALMESAVAAVTVWLAVGLLKLIDQPTWRWGMGVGVLMALGIWIKTSAVVPVIALLGLWGISLVFARGKQAHASGRANFWSKHSWLPALAAWLSASILGLLPLLIQPGINQVWLRHDRYTLSAQDGILALGQHLLTNLAAAGEIWWAYATPGIALIVLLSVCYLIWNWERQLRSTRYLVAYCLLLMLGFILSVRTPSARYLMPFAPVALVLVAAALKHLSGRVQVGLAALPLIFGAAITLLSIINPVAHFNLLARLSPTYSQQADYLTNWTAGWAVTDALTWLQAQSLPDSVNIALRPDAGNPESAALVQLRNPRFTPQYLPELAVYTNDQGCLTFSPNTVLVARDNHLDGSDEYWTEVARFPNPGGVSSVGLYKPQIVCPTPTPGSPPRR